MHVRWPGGPEQVLVQVLPLCANDTVGTTVRLERNRAIINTARIGITPHGAYYAVCPSTGIQPYRFISKVVQDERLYLESWAGKLGHSHFQTRPLEVETGQYQGVPLAPYRIEQLRMALTGRAKTPEHRKNISAAKKGIPISEKTKLAISMATKGKPHALEHNAKVSAALIEYHKRRRLNAVDEDALRLGAEEATQILQSNKAEQSSEH